MEEKEKVDKLSTKDIKECIRILEILNKDSVQIFDLEKQERVRLMKAAGQLSRPSREQYLDLV